MVNRQFKLVCHFIPRQWNWWKSTKDAVPMDSYSPSSVHRSTTTRRTFIGNAYFKVSDPNLIGRMSGHVDGSRAFKRYRNIEDETLKSVIDLIG